ncbi:MAG: hypothetical protein JWQ28_2766 [Pedobacter sp.]|jgi:hypothetical protein|nr:hypothetical protein [Pedobacter sp.]
MRHSFHIPVLGLGYSVDTPLKVAKFGISSVVSIVDDELLERMREHHCIKNNIPFHAITVYEQDHRAKRTTAYLNLLNMLVIQQLSELKKQDFLPGTDLSRYFQLLPDDSDLKVRYKNMLQADEKVKIQLVELLKEEIKPGNIDVNIMSKVDKANYTTDKTYTGDDFTDAIAAMRGFAESSLSAAVVISAGLNPRLYAYMERCSSFYPTNGKSNKQIILKVSDYRSAIIQAKMLAKRGLWVTEFRIESGLNCGGHAFATDGLLIGPILEEFKTNRSALLEEIFSIYKAACTTKGIMMDNIPDQQITYQGGVGTSDEHKFLLNHYELNAAGWGSPFLLVPEATNVDEDTLTALVTAEETDFYISNSSPLGVLFNNFSKSSAEDLRRSRIEKGRPGSPCKKKYLCTNTEFTSLPICTASREYQHLKLAELDALNLAAAAKKAQFELITEKVCLCEGLCASVYLKNGLLKPRESKAVSICPGPNLAFFSGKYTLATMIDHIYGRVDLLSGVNRPNLFVNELNLYIKYLKKDLASQCQGLSDKKAKYFNKFSAQLQQGIDYYKRLLPELKDQQQSLYLQMEHQLLEAEAALEGLMISLRQVAL